MEFNEIEYSICDVSCLLKRMFNAAMKEIGLSNIERRTLMKIKRFPGITQIELARKLEIEPQNMLRILDRLEDRQWISKQQDPNDRRSKHIFVTQEAEPILKQIRAKADDLHQRVFRDMPAEEIESCQRTLDKIKHRFCEELTCIDEQKKLKIS
ncbi:MAG: MarR family transcriptional regulator [Gammaproteobacteria bacterium]|nr:MarR family transcriptional regulator [Gammaproteobacteria bacterium]MCH9745007.1 MarR family transcriptional regulator [Gammaproteobacteria bacterium]